jgi:hypothetical protein
MARGASTFKQTDITKAIKAAVKAGVKDWRVEIADGKIMIAAAPASAPDTDHETSADIRKLL